MVVETYSHEAAEFDEFGHGLAEKSDRKLVEVISPSAGQRVLDVATGTGNLALALADRVGAEGKVVGIDLAQGMLEFAERKARARKVKNVEYRMMDARHLEFEDNTFDLVTCGLAVFYFPDIPGTLAEMCRVLKPGGRMVLSSADPETAFAPLSKPYMERLRKVSEEMDLHPPEYSETAKLTRTAKGLEQLLTQAGLQRVHAREESIPVHFTSPSDWWKYGRGSTWGDLLLQELPEEKRLEFEKEHLKEIEQYFTEEGVKTGTPILLGIGQKPYAHD
ncbi:MAG: class I SAM-dependent methyltransferase [Chloroflexota bacterium]|nr:class I SAM-dependent methyltransferase [Chloroflexota bacterium]